MKLIKMLSGTSTFHMDIGYPRRNDMNHYLALAITFGIFVLLLMLGGCSTPEERRAREQAEQDRWNSLSVDEKLTEIHKQQAEIQRRQHIQLWRSLK